MTRPWITLTLGTVAVAALVGVVAWRASAPEPPSHPVERRADDDARTVLRLIADESSRWMPEGLGDVHLGMTLAALRARRPRLQPGRGARPGTLLWDETLDSGARLVTEFGARAQVLVRVQVLSRLDDPAGLGAHFAALRARFGEPTGFWDCPEAADASPIRRITWRGARTTLTEAVLVHAGGASVTLVVAANEDVARALTASACTPVTAETLGRWPIARVLRGERIDVTEMRSTR